MVQYEEFSDDAEFYDADTYDGDEYDDGSGLEDVPEVIRGFIHYFHRNVREQSVYDIHQIYEETFNKLTEKYFKSKPWPEPDSIATLVDDDEVFMVLYKELYYRHIYARLQVTIEQRFSSFENYCELFGLILDGDVDLAVDLPNQWLWDIVDEFVYQCQEFYVYRSRVKNRSEEEVALLRVNPQVWNVKTVIDFLKRLVAKSSIVELLEAEAAGRETEVSGFAARNLFKMLGYFSIIGLCRVYVLLGDYHTALRVLDPLDINAKITAYYYMGFSYMMMRRYVDAIKTFSNILLYIARTKQHITRSYQHDMILKKNEQMNSLLALNLSLCPQRIDESLHQVLRDKYGEKMNAMMKGTDTTFEELFTYACPKFISPILPNFDNKANQNTESMRLQLKLFMREVSQQKYISQLRQFLKLYTTIDVNKTADFLSEFVGSGDELRMMLLSMKHKTNSLVWSGGSSPTAGEWVDTADVEYFLEEGMIHIVDSKAVRRYDDFFIRHIAKFKEIIADMGRRKVAARS